MDRSNLWRNPDHALWALLVAGILLFGTGSLGQTTSDVTITFTYDPQGNRTFEAAKTGSVTDPSIPSVSLSLSSDTQSASTKSGTAYAFSHISATATGGSPPYTFHWAPLSPTNCNNASSFWVPADFWAANTSADSMFESSSLQGTTATFCGQWQIIVYDSLGTPGTPQPIVTITHSYTPN
jgi:hypothetical protein